MVTDMTTDRPFIPAMGHGGPLALYAPLTRLIGMPRVHRELVARADLRPGHRVLEIGCGPGGLLAAIARERPDAAVVGLDPDPDALARAARRAPGATLVPGTAAAVPEPDGSFDRVLSSFMLHHLAPDEQRAALAEAARVLRPGGQVHVVDVSPAARGPMARRMLAHHGAVDVAALLTGAGFTDLAAATGRTLVGEHTFHRATR
jgi:ubiquinone/menaquinone biosynthesis C-methylase UbiE